MEGGIGVFSLETEILLAEMAVDSALFRTEYIQQMKASAANHIDTPGLNMLPPKINSSVSVALESKGIVAYKIEREGARHVWKFGLNLGGSANSVIEKARVQDILQATKEMGVMPKLPSSACDSDACTLCLERCQLCLSLQHVESDFAKQSVIRANTRVAWLHAKFWRLLRLQNQDGVSTPAQRAVANAEEKERWWLQEFLTHMVSARPSTPSAQSVTTEILPTLWLPCSTYDMFIDEEHAQRKLDEVESLNMLKLAKSHFLSLRPFISKTISHYTNKLNPSHDGVEDVGNMSSNKESAGRDLQKIAHIFSTRYVRPTQERESIYSEVFIFFHRPISFCYGSYIRSSCTGIPFLSLSPIYVMFPHRLDSKG
jgi:hypothetical protein